MAKKDNAKRIATDAERLLAHHVTLSRQYAKGWKETDAVYTATMKGSVDVNTTLITADGKEVCSVTEGAPPAPSYDIERFFKDHPDQLKDLEKNYRNPQKDPTVTLTCKWIEPGAPDPADGPIDEQEL